MEVIDTIEDSHILENQNQSFGKGTYLGNLLIGLPMKIHQSTYHFKTPPETLQNKAENIPSFMKITPTSKQNSPIIGFHPTLKLLEDTIRQIRYNITCIGSRLLCSLGQQVMSRLPIAETSPKSKFLNSNIKINP